MHNFGSMLHEYRGVALGLVLALGFLVFWRTGVIQEAVAWITAQPEGGIRVVLDVEQPSLRPPTLRRRLGGSLDAIDSLLDQMQVRPRVVQRVARSERAVNRSTRKISINTTGPIEPSDFPRSEVGARVQPRFSGDWSPGAVEYPVERFSSPKVFEVIARTHVVTEPAYTAEEVVILHVGHKVEAEGRHGPWLRLRSKSGRVGFVLAQDTQAR